MGKPKRHENRIELLHGTLDMLVLQTLRWGSQHGYGIGQAIRTGSGDVLQVETGSLYPALHRLEKQGWITSEWKPSEHNQRAKYYRLTASGRKQQSTAITIPELRSILKHANSALANSTITTMDEIVEDSLGSQRLAAHLLEIFGGAALLLCVAGLYGLLAYVVTQRTRELGVRMALGAKRKDVVSLVMRQAGIMLLVGLIVGTALALASARLIQSFLYGVPARDGWTLAYAATLLLVSGLSAAWLPARTAASVEPMKALRTE